MIIPDPLKRTVKIPVRIVDGKAEYFYGGPFPKIRKAIGDLVVPAFAIVEKPFIEECSDVEGSKILEKGTILMVNVWADSDAAGLCKGINTGSLSGNVEVRLLQPLILLHRGTKSSGLASCRCFIPCLNQTASSLNHAYTIISKHFETKRHTNTGNVFKKVYFQTPQFGWQMLQSLREKYDAQFERRYSANRRQETTSLELADSGIIEQCSLWEDYEGSMSASIDTDGLTIEEHEYGDNDKNDSRQTVRTGSVHKVLFELLKERFSSAAEFDSWLDKKGLPIELREGFPAAALTRDITDDLDSIIEELYADEKIESIEAGVALLSLDCDEEKRVIVDESSYKLLDDFFVSGWIRAGRYFKRRPFFPFKPEPRRNIPVRIRLKDFSLSKQQRRVLRKNADLKVEVVPLFITREEEELFDRHKRRFNRTPPKSIYDVIPKASLTEIKKVTVTEGDRLLAVSFLDIGKTSTYSLYGAFEPTVLWRSLGILTILKEIEYSIYKGKEFYYLGFVYDGPSYYDYKKHFRGLEFFDWKGNWKKHEVEREKQESQTGPLMQLAGPAMKGLAEKRSEGRKAERDTHQHTTDDYEKRFPDYRSLRSTPDLPLTPEQQAQSKALADKVLPKVLKAMAEDNRAEAESEQPFDETKYQALKTAFEKILPIVDVETTQERMTMLLREMSKRYSVDQIAQMKPYVVRYFEESCIDSESEECRVGNMPKVPIKATTYD